MPREATRGRKRRGKPFCKGFDPRRHIFTPEECSRGGFTTAKRYTCVGRWYPDWHDRCSRKVRDSNGDFIDGEEEGSERSRDAARRGGTGHTRTVHWRRKR